MKKGYILRKHGLIQLRGRNHAQLLWVDEDTMARCWPGIKGLTPIGKCVPAEYQGVGKTFTINLKV